MRRRRPQKPSLPPPGTTASAAGHAPSATADLLLGIEPLDGLPARRGRRRKLALPAPSEAQVENAVRHRLELYGCMCQANRNEARSAAEGRPMQIRGTHLGFPDLTVVAPSGGHVAFLEIKAPGAKPSGPMARAHWQRQAAIRAGLARRGCVVALVTSQDEAVAVLRAAGWPVR